MKVENLRIDRRQPYDTEYPNMLVGIVQLIGYNGKMEVKLSNATVSKIFSLIKDDCQRVANSNASKTAFAIEEAENECPLLEVSESDI